MSERDFLERAAEVYAASGNPKALRVADHLRTAALQPQAPADQPVALGRHLSDAMRSSTAHPIAEEIATFAAGIPWQVAPSLQAKLETCDRHAFVELIGPDGLTVTDGLRFGLYLQAPDTIYARHRHAAEELYYVVSGTADWQKDDAPFAPHEPGTLIHHVPWQDHATTTHGEPLLAMWAWLGDLNPQSYRMSVDNM